MNSQFLNAASKFLVVALLYVLFASPTLAQGTLPSLPSDIDNANSQCRIAVSGEADNTMLEDLKQLSCDRPHIVISSYGGRGDIGLDIADLVRSREARLTVVDRCLSSCAEFILPAASEINFVGAPLVGFHGNPALIEWLAVRSEHESVEACEFEESNRMYDLYLERGVDFGFFHLQVKVLRLLSFGLDYEAPTGECPSMNYVFEHDMWFPSAKTLREDLGLVFSGSVCADSPDECASRVKSIYAGRGTFVVDDRIVSTLSEPALP